MESKLSELITRLKSETTSIDNREKDYTIVATNDEVKRINDKLFHNGQELVFQNPDDFNEFRKALRNDVIRPFNTRKS